MLVCDSLNMDSILFIENQLVNILELGLIENKKILIVANLKFVNQANSYTDTELNHAQKNFSVLNINSYLLTY